MTAYSIITDKDGQPSDEFSVALFKRRMKKYSERLQQRIWRGPSQEERERDDLAEAERNRSEEARRESLARECERE